MKRSLSLSEKKFGLICGVLVLGLGGVGVLRARLDAEPDWGIPAPKPRPKPNGYDLYVAAQKSIIPANPPVDPVNNTQLVTDPKQIEAQYSLARRTAWINQNAKAWALFDQAKAADSMHPVDRSSRSSVGTKYSALRELARCKVILVNTAKMRGDWNGAAQNGLDIFELGGDVSREGTLMAYLVSSAIVSIGESTFNDIPAHLNGKEARNATRRLEKLMGTYPSLVDALREERWVGLSRMREILTNERWRRARTWGTSTSPVAVLKIQFLSKRQIVDSFNRAADWSIANAQQPYSVNLAALPEPDNIVNRLFNPNYSRVKFSQAQPNTQSSLLLLRLALRAYRVEKGNYPATLSELAPSYIAKIPLDPFGNKTPLRYRKTGDSYLLWSVGPDGKDDKGKPTPPRGNRKIARIVLGDQGDTIVLPDWK